ncbi:MAG: hypothetical protein ACPHIA_07840 [Alphaproteobacteria bacterium]
MNEELQKRMQALAKLIYAKRGALPVIDRHKQPDAWNAWRAWRESNGLPVAFMDKSERWTVVSEFPPADFELLELEYKTGGLRKRLSA